MSNKNFIAGFLILLQSTVSAQQAIHYTLQVVENDLPAFHSTMELLNMPSEFHIAVIAHPEYDNHCWQYVDNFHAESAAGKTIMIREDSAL